MSKRVGDIVSCSTGAWNGPPTSYSYQWQRSLDGMTWTSISGATASTYVVTINDRYIRCLVTATNFVSSATAISSVIDLFATFLSQNPDVLALAAASPDSPLGPVICIGRRTDAGVVLKIGTFKIGERTAVFVGVPLGAGGGITSATPDILP